MSMIAVPPPVVPEHFPDVRRTKGQIYETGSVADAYPSSPMKSSSGVSNRSNVEYKYPRDARDQITEGHEYLEVDVLSRIKSLQNEIDNLRGTVNNSGSDSSKIKEASIYEKIDKVKINKHHSDYDNGMTLFLFKGLKSRGFFGLSHLFNPTNRYCRFIWLTLILAALCLTSYQIYDRVTHFQSAPRRLYIDNQHAEKLPFPTVTICNLNTFRLSRVAKLGTYSIIHTLQHARPPLPASVANFSKLGSFTVNQFMKTTRHRKEDLIYRCQWQGKPCGVNNFTTRFTGKENCVSFQVVQDQKYVTKTGPHTGLYVVINIEQYEYILGPTTAVGAKIAVHHRDAPARSFVHLPVGKLTSIEINNVQRAYPKATGLEKFLNLRSDWSEVYADCSRQCREVAVVAKCGCSLSLVQSEASAIPCSMMDWFTCVNRAIDSEQCGCTHKSANIDGDYEMRLSYAAIPKYGIESELRSFSNRDELEKKFRNSLDLYHTYDTIMMNYDQSTLNKLLTELDICTNETRSLSEFTTSYSLLYKEKANELQDKFLRLSIMAKQHYLFFEASSHISFGSVITLLENSMVYVVDKEQQALAINQPSMQVVALEQILAKIEDMVDVDKSTGKKLITEIEDGVNLFRDRLVLGYGQSYKPLRDRRKYYNEISLAMRNITHSLKTTLIAEYMNVKRIKENLITDGESLSKLRTFFNKMKLLTKHEMRSLESHRVSLISAYREDKLKILKSIRQFNFTISQFNTGARSINSVIILVNETSSMLYAKIRDVEQKLRYFAVEYMDNRIGKSEFSDWMNDDRLQSGLTQVKDTMKALSSNIDDLREKSSTLSHTITQTSAIDFSLFTNAKTERTLAWFGESPLLNRVVTLLAQTEDTLRGVENYQNELHDYTNSRRVNEAFYRNNFLHIDTYFKDMSVTVTREYLSYTLIDLTSDIGCTLALYLGASILSVLQLIEFIHASSHHILSNRRR